MMRSTVVMVVEAVMKLDISIPNPGRQGPLEVNALAGLVKERRKWITKDSDANICVRNCEGIFVAFCTSSSKGNSCFTCISEQEDYDWRNDTKYQLQSQSRGFAMIMKIYIWQGL
jgi:hypothetical protein